MPVIPPGSEAVVRSMMSCASSYHAALSAVHAASGDRMARAVKAMGRVDAALPGRWLFWGPPGQSGRQRIETRRQCVVLEARGGRTRCARFEERLLPGPIPAQVPAKAPGAEELKALRFVDETVRGKGALVEFGANGRYKVMSERFADDVRIYTSQPVHPALCTGAGDLLEFYREALAPLRKRISVVADATQRVRRLAASRFNIAAAVLAARSAASAADPAKVEEKEGAPAGLRDMIGALMRLAADADVARAVAGEGEDMSAMARAHAWVASEQASGLLPTERETLLVALQMIEALIYAETLRTRYAEINAALFGTLDQLMVAQKKSCTCEE